MNKDVRIGAALRSCCGIRLTGAPAEARISTAAKHCLSPAVLVNPIVTALVDEVRAVARIAAYFSVLDESLTDCQAVVTALTVSAPPAMISCIDATSNDPLALVGVIVTV
jgi:hypothetical protein